MINLLRNGLGSARLTPVILVGLIAALQYGISTGDRTLALPGMLFSGMAILAGCLMLAWVRPQRAGLSPPHVMLSLGFGGMLLGLAVDLAGVEAQMLATLCTRSASMNFFDALHLHWTYLPGMHVGMLVGGLAAIPSLRILRPECGRYLCSVLAQNLLCSGWMLVGMTLGALAFVGTRQAFGSNGLGDMFGGMFAGMVWGMVISVCLYRTYLNWRERQLSRAAAPSAPLN
jgi:hypothetical protein